MASLTRAGLLPYETVLFDLDGTLTDSGPGIMRCAAYALEKLGCPVRDPYDLRAFVGPPLGQTFEQFGVPRDQVEEAIRLYRSVYTVSGKYENSPYEGILPMLNALKMRGCRLCVATSKPEVLSVQILQHFRMDSCFDVIAGATMDHTRENKDDVIRYLLGMTGNTGPTVMVGDTRFDVEGAARLSIPCIGVSWGYGDVTEMLNAGAAAIADTPDELFRLLTAGC